MPRDCAAWRALPRSRDASARISVSGPRFMPGRLTRRAKSLAPSTPQRTGTWLGALPGTWGAFDMGAMIMHGFPAVVDIRLYPPVTLPVLRSGEFHGSQAHGQG